MRQEKVLFPNL